MNNKKRAFLKKKAHNLEPIELKEWFIEKYENALKNLKNK